MNLKYFIIVILFSLSFGPSLTANELCSPILFQPSDELIEFFKVTETVTKAVNREVAKEVSLQTMKPNQIIEELTLQKFTSKNFEDPSFKQELSAHLKNDTKILEFTWEKLDEVYSDHPQSLFSEIKNILKKHRGEKNFDLNADERFLLNEFWTKSYALYNSVNFLKEKYKDIPKLSKVFNEDKEMMKLIDSASELRHLSSVKYIEKISHLTNAFIPADKLSYDTAMYVVDRFINVPDFDLNLPKNTFYNVIFSALEAKKTEGPITLKEKATNTPKLIFQSLERVNAEQKRFKADSRFKNDPRYEQTLAKVSNSKTNFEREIKKIQARLYKDVFYEHFYLNLESAIGKSLRLKMRYNDDDPSRNGAVIITDQEREDLKKELVPGDLLFNLTNYFVMNLIMPGSWAHTWTYIGEYDQIKQTFEDEVEVNDYYKNKCDVMKLNCSTYFEYLNAAYPEHMQTLKESKYKDKFPFDAIDARGDGIVLTSMHRSGQADHLLALRPNLPALEKAMAIDKQLARLGAPFDIDLDFVRSDRFACSELVRDSFRNLEGFESLEFDDYHGEANILSAERKNLAPSKFVEKFLDEKNETDRQFDFIYFIDGDLKTRKSIIYTQEQYGPKGPDELKSGFEEENERKRALEEENKKK